MNRAQVTGECWVVGPFKWPGEVDLKKWTVKEPPVRAYREAIASEANGKVMDALKCGAALTVSSIVHHSSLDPVAVGWALKRLAMAGAVMKASANLWKLCGINEER